MLFEVRTPSQARHPSDLTPEIKAALAMLADAETRYETERERLRHSPDPFRQRRLARLEESHRAEREPLVQRLAALQQAMTLAMMCREAGMKLGRAPEAEGSLPDAPRSAGWPNACAFSA